MRLRRRSQFLAAARGLKEGRSAFLLQMRTRRADEAQDGAGLGITVTRKIGNAVVRNRAKRRLRAALRIVIPATARTGHDYVVVARARVLDQPFADLTRDLAAAIASLGRRRAERQR